MDTVSIFGWIAASLVLSSFYFRNMTSLRLAAIASNVLFIIYAILANAWPILVLHCLLFPLNLWRLLELHNLRRTLMGSSLVQVQVSAVRLLPFMQKSKSAQGGVIFEKGDAADHVYYLLQGEILLQDSKKLVTDGQLLGLTGVFSNERRRTDSALCLTDVEYGVIPAKGSGYWCVRTPCLEISSSVPWCSASSLCTKNRNRCGLKTHSHEFREAGKPGSRESRNSGFMHHVLLYGPARHGLRVKPSMTR